MSEMGKVLALPHKFTFRGREYEVGPRTFEVEALFAKHLEREALSAVQRHREAMHPLEYAQQLKDWRNDCAAHAFDWGGPNSFQALLNPFNLKHLCWLQMKRVEGHHRLPDGIVDELYQSRDLWPGIEEYLWNGSDTDPNPKTGAEPADAPPPSEPSSPGSSTTAASASRTSAA